MRVLRGIEQLAAFIEQEDCSEGCLADTGFLYGMAYKDDSFHPEALEVSLILEDTVPIHANVIGRMEFVDLVFRKIVTRGAVQLYKSMDSTTENRKLFNLVKWVRDREATERRERKSFKIGEYKLKELRRELVAVSGDDGWKQFCSAYAGQILVNEWALLEDDFGLSFIELMEGQTSSLVPNPLYWSEMVGAMGNYGIRGPDAMILNLFKACSLKLLVTTDQDFNFAESDDPASKNKAVFILKKSEPDEIYLKEIEHDDD